MQQLVPEPLLTKTANAERLRPAVTQIRRQTPLSRAHFEGLQPHQSFDPMQPASMSCHTRLAKLGSIAGEDSNLRA
jgi:hypothetical protein